MGLPYWADVGMTPMYKYNSRIMWSALPSTTSSTGPFNAASPFEAAGAAEVDGFYRLPSFNSCEAERCQQDYSAMKAMGS